MVEPGTIQHCTHDSLIFQILCAFTSAPLTSRMCVFQKETTFSSIMATSASVGAFAIEVGWLILPSHSYLTKSACIDLSLTHLLADVGSRGSIL